MFLNVNSDYFDKTDFKQLIFVMATADVLFEVRTHCQFLNAYYLESASKG
jgi:hypothetical protein